MEPASLPTREVASLLGVTETTVKRWADSGRISCIRTPGGHRKFLLSDVARFAESQGLKLAGAQPPPMTQQQLEQLQIGVALRDYRRIAAVLKEEALQGDRKGLVELLLYLFKHQFTLPLVADEILRPAFSEIGVLWQNGKLRVNQEHAASSALEDALILSTASLHRKPARHKAVVCACPSQELHALGLRCIAYSLEVEGWDVQYIGPNTPLTDIADQLPVYRPALVCVSVTIVRQRRQLLRELELLRKAVHAHKGIMVVGGRGAGQLRDVGLRADYVADGVQDAIAFVKEQFHLKPGPRRKHANASTKK